VVNVIVDTDVLIGFLHRDAKATEFLRKNQGSLETTSITAAELYKGAFSKGGKHLAAAKGLLSSMLILDFTPAAAEVFGELYSALAKKGSTASDFDLLIASITIANSGILATRDKKLQSIPGLKTIEW